MANILIYDPISPVVSGRTTGYYLSVNTPDYDGETNKLVNPDVGSLSAVSTEYWKVSGSSVIEMTTEEKGYIDNGFAGDGDVTDWYNNGLSLLSDRIAYRDKLRNIFIQTPWSAHTNSEKDIVTDLYGYYDGSFVTFTGITGHEDFHAGKDFSGSSSVCFEVVIDSTGTTHDTFKWRKDEGSFTTNIPTTGTSIHLSDGQDVYFSNATGHVINDTWKICCIVNADTDKVIHLMTTKGLSQLQAQGYLLNAWHNHFQKYLVDCAGRWNMAIKETLKFLSRPDAEDLFDTVGTLADKYLKTGRLGRYYHDNADGIMDYIESTNGFYNQGLKENEYDLVMGDWNTLITSLKNILVYGNYDKNEIIS